MARLIDLSHEIEDGMVTYRGLPAPVISDWLTRDASKARYGAGTTFQIGRIELLANTGTYIDAPFHRYEDGRDVAGYALDVVGDLPCLGALPDAGFHFYAVPPRVKGMGSFPVRAFARLPG